MGKDWHSVMRGADCVHWFESRANALHYVRRKLSGKDHKRNKRQAWRIVRGRV